jgi:mannose-6-phosphate isomerase class I
LEAGPENWSAAGTVDAKGDWPERLRRIVLDPGDRCLMPKGLVRAQGPSMTVLKVLPLGAKLLTVHDWGRRPDPFDFAPPAGGIAPTNAAVTPRFPENGGHDRILLRAPDFVISAFNADFRTSAGGVLTVLCPIKGSGRIMTSGVKESVRLRPGQAVIIPAGIGRYSLQSGTTISCLAFSLK